MPGEERSSRGADRCSLHPSQPAVARCDVCERAMCLTCTVPVRGGTVGHECLAVALGPDAPPPEPPERPPADVRRWLVRGAFLVAALATVLPWSRFGTGSDPFGAWGDSPRWSILAAVAAVTGLAVSLVPWRDRRRVGVVEGALATMVVVASVLAMVQPPAFTSPWLGPWIAIGAGAVALAGASLRLVGRRVGGPSRV